MNFWDKLLLKSIKNFPNGSIEIEWPDGTVKKINGVKKGPNANLKFIDSKVTMEIINGGAIKFAELYVNKRISSKNLTCLMYYCALNNDEAEDAFNVSFFKFLLTDLNLYKRLLRFRIVLH